MVLGSIPGGRTFKTPDPPSASAGHWHVLGVHLGCIVDVIGVHADVFLGVVLGHLKKCKSITPLIGLMKSYTQFEYLRYHLLEF